MELAEKINEAAEDKAEIDADIVKKVAYTAAGELSPMAATLGGIVGQEVDSPSMSQFCSYNFNCFCIVQLCTCGSRHAML